MNVPAQEDPLESLLSDHEHRKQEDARHQIKRALRLEEARKRGASYLHLFAIDTARDVAARLTEAGHRVMHQEFLDAYPPNIRLHLWPKPGPLDREEPQRSTLELVWGEPERDALAVRRLTSEGPEVQGLAWPRGQQAVAAILFTHEQDKKASEGDILDDLWVKEQLLVFVRETLEGGPPRLLSRPWLSKGS